VVSFRETVDKRPHLFRVLLRGWQVKENPRFSKQTGHAARVGKKRHIRLAALLIAILVGITWMLMPRPEPVYGGKLLSAWLEEYNRQNFYSPRSSDSPADVAIRHIGTNAFPMIAQRLRYRDSALKSKLIQFLESHPRLHFPFQIPTQDEYNAQAIFALRALGWDAKPLIPTLAEAMDHFGLPNHLDAMFWLQSLRSEGEAAIPALIRILKDKNNKFRFVAVITLSFVGEEQTNRVLPVLEECLQDPDAFVRSEATNAFSRDPWIELKEMDHPGIVRKKPVPMDFDDFGLYHPHRTQVQ
jgi:hypothetical protein